MSLSQLSLCFSDMQRREQERESLDVRPLAFKINHLPKNRLINFAKIDFNL